MTTHPYSLRSRVSSSSLATKTPTHSPLPRLAKSPRKGSTSPAVLQLKRVIGTTTSTPNGLSSCAANNSYAYCAGAVAVYATIDSNELVSYRYFKARPTAAAINRVNSYYDSPSATTTPTRRRTLLNSRRGYEDYGISPVSSQWLEEGGSQTWSARERIKTASCVSISPDGRILAVGESGYNPRVLLFSTDPSMPSETPLSIITDHSIGVRGVAFSANSKYLATLGDVNDGFLYVWHVNTRTGVVNLSSSNKCTTNVCDMTWCGSTVITVGTRHIKIWQASTPGNRTSPQRKVPSRSEIELPGIMPTPLHGRNCLLGPFVDATFTAVVAVSNEQAVVCTDDGYICLLDLAQGKTELKPIDKQDEAVSSISYRPDTDRIVWAGDGDPLNERDLSQVSDAVQLPRPNQNDVQKRRKLSRQSLLRQSLGLSPLKRANMVALSCLRDKIVCIDAEGLLRVSRVDTYEEEQDICRLASHEGLVRGVQRLSKEAGLGSFFTWARNGDVRFWQDVGELVKAESIDLDENSDIDSAATNELKIVRHSQRNRSFVAGDQLGVLRVIDQGSWSCTLTVRAHSAEVNSIDIHEGSSMVATCGRDRMVQIFLLQDGVLELQQTSDDHISAVNQVLFSENGSRLLSCSADRTVVVRERVERKLEREIVCAFIPARTITLKAAPLSMSFVPFREKVLAISAMDRHIVQVDSETGATLTSFKVSDRDSDETVILNSICLAGTRTTGEPCLLAGYSAIDKSVRLYDLEKGLLLARESGHTEGISDIVMFDDSRPEDSSSQMTIVSTGLDSTIMIWSASAVGQPALTPQLELSQAVAFGGDSEKTAFKASPVSLPPLRKVLSKMDIAEFAQQQSPTREISPNGLRRKASRLALTTSIEETDEASPVTSKEQSRGSRMESENRSPSPQGLQVMKPKKQRSRTEMNKTFETRIAAAMQSPSPPAASASVPVTPKHNTRANNGRLRRPPSVPNDLRAQGTAQSRRQSVSSTNDFGSIGMATEQACRMLKTYGKKLQANRSELDLDEIEAELQAVLAVVRQKKARTMDSKVNGHMKVTMEDVDVDDGVTGLGVLLEKTSVS